MHGIVPKVTLLVCVAVGLPGCGKDPVNVDPNAAVGAAAPLAAVVGNPDDIQALIDAEAAAWAAKDATAFAAGYAVDAKFFDPTGGLADGREAIRAQHAFLFAGPFATSTETQVITGVRFLTGTIALVYSTGTLTGYGPLPPGVSETEPGVLRTTRTLVVVKRANTWEIVSKHMAPVAPAPAS